MHAGEDQEADEDPIRGGRMKDGRRRTNLVGALVLALVIVAGCTLYPRVEIREPEDSGDKDVLARFMRTENRENATLLSSMMTREFEGHLQEELQQYVVAKGGTCSVAAKVLRCLYEQTLPATFSRPPGSLPGAQIPITFVRSFAINSSGDSEGLNAKIVSINVRIRLSTR